MNQGISHRGPDASGYSYFNDNKIQLGHKRLSIIDLTENANQPMTSSCGNFTIIFNGEIYNYKELRKEIRKLNPDLSFHTSSDTEVLLNAFITWKEKCVNKLNGMFSFAVYDVKKQRISLFRDRVGIKPLYYYHKDGVFAFGSELKALFPLQNVLHKFSISKKAINSFFRFGYIPGPLTIYNNIYKLLPGEFICIDKKDFKIKKYWSLSDNIQKKTLVDETKVLADLHSTLESSIEYRLQSDVSYGTLLSGGIDSSLVTSIASQKQEKKINTYSLGFEDDPNNEVKHAEKVSKYLGTNHHSFVLKNNDVISLFEEVNNIFEEPFADTSFIPTFLVSKMAAKDVKMVLTGDGGDELFMGYGRYSWAERIEQAKTFKSLLKLGFSKFPSPKYKYASNFFDFNTSDNIMEHIFSVEQGYFNNKEISLLLNKSNETNLGYYSPPLYKRSLTAREKQSFYELATYLPEDLLTKVDRCTMQNSLEARVPLLDHRIVEMSLNIQQSLKRKNGQDKYLLKKLLSSYLPEKLYDRPKWGFSIPLHKWLSNELNFLIEDYLNIEELKKQQIFNVDYIKQLKYRFYNGENNLYAKIWLLIVMQMFLRKNN